MSTRKPGAWIAGAVLIAALFGAGRASAFCQATTCDPRKTDCKPNSAGCFTVGFPLWWASNCVTVDVQADGSASQNIDYETAEASVSRAFAAWNDVSCSGGKPSIAVKVQGPITCDASEYNQDRGNANIVVFRDEWPYVGGEDALGLTRVRFNPDTGEIYDSDIEVNTVTEPLSVGDPIGNAVDLDSLLTHEAGHLLGLGHSLEDGATMNPGYNLGSIALRSLTTDDVTGLCSIYPPTRKPSSTSCEPRHGFSELCGADQPVKAPDTDNNNKKDAASSSCSFSLHKTSSSGAIVALGVALTITLRRRRRFVAASLTTAALAGCSLDTRQLQYATGGAGQASAGSPSTPNAGTEQGGSSARDPETPIMIDGCLDLDEDGVADCDETLIQNATFKTDVDAWHADGEAQLKWDERNAAADLPSGSALIDATGAAAPGADGTAPQSASQCSKVNGKRLVTVYANAFVDAGQTAQARVDVQFFDNDTCAGGYAASFSTPQPLDAESGKWLALKAGSVSSESTKSVLVRLVVSRPLDEASVQASFDNVLLKATAIE